ncbi:MAG: mandelate racemase/muconate lactonizing enzyme family protein, partial [Proteobacteria bacterium]|nr:mandelate racemase/muconate lactonizing enzyme family protein [Pseudomonadota bacterium]
HERQHRSHRISGVRHAATPGESAAIVTTYRKHRTKQDRTIGEDRQFKIALAASEASHANVMATNVICRYPTFVVHFRPVLDAGATMSQITSVQCHHLTGNGMPQLIVEVHDAEGGVGFGEAWWGIPDREQSARGAAPIASAIDNIIAPMVVGKDAARINQIWYETWDYAYRYGDGGIITMALSGLDIALWDLKARHHNEPLVNLLGGPVRERIPAYASLPPLRTRERLTEEVGRALEHGFRAIKLHELASWTVALVRDLVGPDIEIMMDVNGHFDVPDAIRLGRELEPFNLLWYEEPVRPMRDIKAIAQVADALDLAIAGGENEYSLADFDRLTSSGILSYIQPEITKIGGVTAALRIGHLIEANALSLCPHNFRLGPSLLASIHCGFANSATRWIEVPWVAESMSFASGTPVPTLVDGAVTIPTGPGIGFELP